MRNSHRWHEFLGALRAQAGVFGRSLSPLIPAQAGIQSGSPLSRGRTVGTGLCALTFVLILAACTTGDAVLPGSVPADYRARHPISLTEGERSVQLFIGTGRGDLTAEQRAQVVSIAHAWNRESTGALVIDVPKKTANARAAQYAVREVQSLLHGAGVPSNAVRIRHYKPPYDEEFGPVRLAYARIEAHAGPCGEWPEDLGARLYPSMEPMPANIGNRPYWNLGCATQRNLAAAVANPEDLVQPRPETPPDAARRQTVIERYRKGENPSGQYETGTARASDVGQ